MMKLLYLFLVILSFNSFGGDEEYSTRSLLESNFERKLIQLYPKNRFSVTVSLNEKKKISVSLFGEVESEKDVDPMDRIKEVSVLSDSPLTVKEYGNVLGIKDDLITTTSIPLPEAESGKESPTAKAEDKSSASNSALPFAIGFTFISGCILWATYIIRNSIKSIPGPITQALSQSENFRNEATSVTQEKTTVQPSVLNKHDPRPEQLLALFSDLYWIGEDRKAAALVSTHQNLEVYKKVSFGEEYLNYIRMLEPEHFEFWEDSYYISPSSYLNEKSIDDMEISDFLVCSRIRLAKCPHSNYELTKLQLSGDAFRQQASKSELRKLSLPFKFAFNSIEEEKSFLQSDLPEYVKMLSPSLYLLSKLSNDEFSEVIKEFNVNELAACWIGPEDILKQLRAKLPERKGQLLDEILKSKKNTVANRHAPAFVKLIKLTQQKGHSKIKSKHNDDRELKLAV